MGFTSPGARSPFTKTALALLAASALPAQTPSVQPGATYQCAPGRSFKVVSCAGNGAAESCKIEAFANGQLMQTAEAPRQQVAALVAACRAQTSANASSSTAPASPAGAGGFKVGDTVRVNTGFGWMDAKVLQVNGNSYYVHTQNGVDVWKSYPAELRRNGPLNAEDRANGIYALHDKVQVNVEGRWEDGEVMTEMGLDYQVRLAGDRAAWAKGPQLRLAPAAAAPPPAPRPGQPPQPGLVSCAGKIEGRYSAGSFGNFNIVFRSGKATISDAYGGVNETECWLSGEKMFLHKPGDPAKTGVSIDINNDGTLDTPFGEIRKKGN